MTVIIKVLGRDEANAWFMGADNPSYVRERLCFCLRRSTHMTTLDAKRLVHGVMKGLQVDIPLKDTQHFDGICHFLSSLGATYEVIGDPSHP